MQKKDCFLYGTIFKLHGYKGNVKIFNENYTSIDFSTVEYFLIEQENVLVPYFTKKVSSVQPNIILVTFEEIDSEEKAKKINKKKIYLPKKHLQKHNFNSNLQEKLIGYTVIDIHIGILGKVIYINTQTPQKLIYVKKDLIEFCFPMHKEFIKETNSAKRTLTVKIPEELLNLN